MQVSFFVSRPNRSTPSAGHVAKQPARSMGAPKTPDTIPTATSADRAAIQISAAAKKTTENITPITLAIARKVVLVVVDMIIGLDLITMTMKTTKGLLLLRLRRLGIVTGIRMMAIDIENHIEIITIGGGHHGVTTITADDRVKITLGMMMMMLTAMTICITVPVIMSTMRILEGVGAAILGDTRGLTFHHRELKNRKCYPKTTFREDSSMSIKDRMTKNRR